MNGTGRCRRAIVNFGREELMKTIYRCAAYLLGAFSAPASALPELPYRRRLPIPGRQGNAARAVRRARPDGARRRGERMLVVPSENESAGILWRARAAGLAGLAPAAAGNKNDFQRRDGTRVVPHDQGPPRHRRPQLGIDARAYPQ